MPLNALFVFQLLTSEREYLQACLDKAASRQHAVAEAESKLAQQQAAHDDEVWPGVLTVHPFPSSRALRSGGGESSRACACPPSPP